MVPPIWTDDGQIGSSLTLSLFSYFFFLPSSFTSLSNSEPFRL